MALTSYTTTRRPSVVSFAFGRAWYGGIAASKWSDTIFFSQVLTDPSKFGSCFQDADPTAEDINSLVASDGGYITVPGAGTIIKMVSLNTSLVILTTNGVWAVFPGQEGFSPASYSVQKIAEEGAVSRKGVTKVEDSVIYVTNAGIYRCFFSREAGGLTVQSITEEKIDTKYRYITKGQKENSIMTYDPSTKRLHVLFGENNTYRLSLNFIFKVNAWYEFDYPDTEDVYRILYAFPHRANSTGADLSYLCSEYDATVGEAYPYKIFFGSHRDPSFKDWFGLYNYESYLETPPLTLDNPQFEKQAMYMTAYFYKTENGFEELPDGSLSVANESSCLLTSKWSWHTTELGNKWSAPQQIYRMERGYIPEDASDTYDDGVSIVTTKNKIPGQGHALSLRFEAEDGKDMRLVGFTLSLQMKGSY